jgi:hypothetical protein
LGVACSRWIEVRLWWGIVGAGAGAAVLLSAAIVFDPGDAAINVLADVFIASTGVVIYHFWAPHESRRAAEVDAWRALQPLWELLWMIRDEIDQGHARLRELAGLDHRHMHEASPLWVERHHWLNRNPRFELRAAYHNLVTACPGPDLSEHVERVGARLDGVVDDDSCLNDVLIEFQRAVREPEPGWTLRRERAGAQAMQAVGKLRRRLSAALSELADARDALHVRVAVGYCPAKVAKETTADPLPPAVLTASVIVAAVSSVAWLGGLWPGRYASAVLDNVLVGLGFTLLGIGVAKKVVQLREHSWRTDQAAEPKEDLRVALVSVHFWAYVGAQSGGWADLRSEPAGQATEDKAIRNAERARAAVRRALHRLQHIAPNAHLDAAGDKLDDLIAQAMAASDDIRAMALVLTEVDRLRGLVEEQFPESHRDYERSQGSLVGAVEEPETTKPWDADLVGKRPGDDGVPDPSRGRWVARADKKRRYRWS